MGSNTQNSTPTPAVTDELSLREQLALIVTEKAKSQVRVEQDLYAFYWQTQQRMNTEAAAIAARLAQASLASSVTSNSPSTQSAQLSEDPCTQTQDQAALIIKVEKTIADQSSTQANSVVEMEESTQVAGMLFPRAESLFSEDSMDTRSHSSADTLSPRPQKSTAWKWSLGVTAILTVVTFAVIAAVFIFLPLAPFLPFFLVGIGSFAAAGALAFAGMVAGGVLLIGGIVTLALACKKDAPEKADNNDLKDVAKHTQFEALLEGSSLEKSNAPVPPPPSAASHRGSALQSQAEEDQGNELSRSFSS